MMTDNEVEAMVTKVIERQPELAVPADFAARVMANLPTVRKRRAAMNLGRKMAIAGAGVLALTLFALAPHTAPSFTNFSFDVELLLLLELAGIGYWFALKESRK